MGFRPVCAPHADADRVQIGPRPGELALLTEPVTDEACTCSKTRASDRSRIRRKQVQSRAVAQLGQCGMQRSLGCSLTPAVVEVRSLVSRLRTCPWMSGTSP